MDVAWRLIKHQMPSECDTTWSGIWIGVQRAQFLGCHFDLFEWTTGQWNELRSTASNRLSKTVVFINLPSDWIRISHVMWTSQSEKCVNFLRFTWNVTGNFFVNRLDWFLLSHVACFSQLAEFQQFSWLCAYHGFCLSSYWLWLSGNRVEMTGCQHESRDYRIAVCISIICSRFFWNMKKATCFTWSLVKWGKATAPEKLKDGHVDGQ